MGKQSNGMMLITLLEQPGSLVDRKLYNINEYIYIYFVPTRSRRKKLTFLKLPNGRKATFVFLFIFSYFCVSLVKMFGKSEKIKFSRNVMRYILGEKQDIIYNFTPPR